MATHDSWTGWVVFAGFVILIVGVMDVLQGFFGILEDEYVVATTKGLAIVDVTAWGWVTLLWGALLIVAGLGLLSGAGWARWLAIVGVGINAIQQVAFLANYPQAYPLWNILIVALNFVVLYALTVRWEGYRESVA
jgi:hypothetical protein